MKNIKEGDNLKISASYLGVKKRNLDTFIYELDKTDVDFIHVDVMDGKYVRNKANSYSEIYELSYYTQKRLDVHFMVRKPLKYIDDFAELNVFCMTFHLNIKNNLDEVIDRCHQYGIKAGIALEPFEDISLLEPFWNKIDLVLVMSVKTGLPGQTFIKETIPKVKALRDKIKKDKRDILINVDGGINLENKDFLGDADILSVGTTISNSTNYSKIIDKLKS